MCTPSRNNCHRQWTRILLLLLLLSSNAIRGQSASGNVDWIFVVDTSASMHGAGGSANVFGKVQAAISEFIRSAREGDTVTLYTFDRDTTLRSHIRISGEFDKRELLKAVAELSSQGDRTYTGKALKDALERAAELKSRQDAGTRTVSIVLLTDGVEDVRGISNPVSIPSNISLIPRDQPYVFFVSMGVQDHDKQLESFVTGPAMGNRGEVIRDPGAESIAEVGERIRIKIEPSKPLTLGLTPSNLDFKQLEPGETTPPQELNVTCDSDCSLIVNLDHAESNGLTLVEPAGAVSLRAGERHQVKLRLKAALEMPNGARTFEVSVTGDPSDHLSKTASVQAKINIIRTSPWRSWLKYLFLLLIALAIALAIISIIKGEPPWIWMPALFEAACLEGELQIISPRPERVEDEFISLTQLRTRRVSLRSLIPNGAISDSDAELEAASDNGKPGVKLRRTNGTVAVNKIEVANTRIYNDDTIELGDTKLLFSCVNQDRPAEHEDNRFV